MIELPEAHVIAQQVTETLRGKQISRAIANASPHKFATANSCLAADSRGRS